MSRCVKGVEKRICEEDEEEQEQEMQLAGDGWSHEITQLTRSDGDSRRADETQKKGDNLEVEQVKGS